MSLPEPVVIQPPRTDCLARYAASMERLVTAVQQLSLARDLGDIMAVVRGAARELVGADGATFVLREGEHCFYADEEAIAPLWKGHRFPLVSCVSGWVIAHRQAVAIEDVYSDERVPVAAYRPTFVRSMLMVPIRSDDPVGAIGCYWATHYAPGEREVGLIQALADTASVAMRNVELYREMAQSNRELRRMNAELEEFAYVASHDLKGPLRGVSNLAQWIDEDLGLRLDEPNRERLRLLRLRAMRMGQLIDSLAVYAGVGRQGLRRREPVALGAVLESLLQDEPPSPGFRVQLEEPLPTLQADAQALRELLGELIANAVRHHDRPEGTLTIRAREEPDHWVIELADDGPGIPTVSRESVFKLFGNLGRGGDGNGIGLALVKKLVAAHGGTISIGANQPRGAVFSIRWPKNP